ncbi:HI0074 family nucleotidyltransferase substrate-binding subunit [Persephonella sp.]
MKKSDLILRIQKFEKALDKLKEAVNQVKDQLDKDGTIQRFEFTIELLWKTLKSILEYKGIECFSPRDCVKQAFKANLIEDRNRSSHIYDEKMSEEIFERIKNVYVDYLENLDLIKKL